MELENIVANTQYLKAMEGKGKSKKWKEMLKFPLIANCGSLEQELRQSGEITYKNACRMPIFKKLFEAFCIYSSKYEKAIKFQEEVTAFQLSTNTAPAIVEKYLSPKLPHFPEEEVHKVLDAIQNAKQSETALPSSLFDSLLAANHSFLSGVPFDEFQKSPFYYRYIQWMSLQRQPIDKDRIRLYRVLGKGGFGEVYACQKRDTGAMYAVKCLDKKRIKKKKAESLAWNERDLLETIDSKFVCGLKYAYEMKDSLCMVLDLMSGGDLQYHLRSEGRFEHSRAVFYAAELVLGLHHIHQAGVLYRDMKPENILLDLKGHVRISDLGLAVRLKKGQAKGRVGTPGYMAPEVIVGEKYGFPVDWWGLGCCFYDMIEGHSPFRMNKEKIKLEKLQKRTLEAEIIFTPEYFQPEAIDIIKKFLNRDPSQRLGEKEGNNIQEILDHPVFSHLNWARLEAGVEEPPFIPNPNAVNAKDVLDIDRFDSIRDVKINSSDNEFFAKFPVVVSRCWQQEMVDTVFEELNKFDPAQIPYDLDPRVTEEPPKKRAGFLSFFFRGSGSSSKSPATSPSPSGRQSPVKQRSLDDTAIKRELNGDTASSLSAAEKKQIALSKGLSAPM